MEHQLMRAGGYLGRARLGGPGSVAAVASGRLIIFGHADDALTIHGNIAPVLHAEGGINASLDGNCLPLLIFCERDFNFKGYILRSSDCRWILIPVSRPLGDNLVCLERSFGKRKRSGNFTRRGEPFFIIWGCVHNY